MALVHSANEPLYQQQQPPSPSLTNPDMILPFDHDSRESTPTPTFGSFAQVSDHANGTQTGAERPTTAGTLQRPAMPGGWETETELPTTGGNKMATNQISGQEAEPSNRSINTYRTANGASTNGVGKSRLGTAPSKANGLERNSSVSSNGSERDPFSQLAFLRAEEILANAKKRLTTMENNLTRARSISITRSASVASNNMDQKSPTSPRFPGSASRGNGWAISAAKLRQTGFTGSAGSNGHTRVFSDTSVPSKSSTFGARRLEGDRLRSTSAMGAKEMDFASQSDDRGFMSRNGGYLEPLHEDEVTLSYPDGSDSPHDQSTPSRLSTHSPSNMTKARSSLQLRDLREQMADLKGKVNSLKKRTTADRMHRRSMQMLKSPNPFTDADAYSSESGTKRSSSSAAHLNVPHTSPGGKASTDGKSTIIDDVSQGTSPIPANKMTPMTDNASEIFIAKDTNKQEPIEDENDDDEPIEVDEIVKPRKQSSDLPNHVDDTRSKEIIQAHEAAFAHDLPPPPKTFTFDPSSPHSQAAEFLDADDLSSDYSITSPPAEESTSGSTYPKASSSSSGPTSSPQTSVSGVEANNPDNANGANNAHSPPTQILSHEDRPDAFDYETFVLNSAMGTFSRQGMRSSSSTSSQSTIGPGMQEFEHPHFLDARSQVSLMEPHSRGPSRNWHKRQSSDDSVSSVNTFATAYSGDEATNGLTNNTNGTNGNNGINNTNGTNGTNGTTAYARSLANSRAASRSASRSATRTPSRAAQSSTTGQYLHTTHPARPHSSTSYTTSYTTLSQRPPTSIYKPSHPHPNTHSTNSSISTARLHRASSHRESSYRDSVSPLSPTNEPSIQVRSQILSALLADPMGRSPRATPEILLGLRTEDEALIRAVIEGLQRVCGGLVRGDGESDRGMGGELRGRLEGARRALEGSEGNGVGLGLGLRVDGNANGMGKGGGEGRRSY